MSGIFISYRREDSQALAGRLFDHLIRRFGKDRVFRDIDAIDPGAKFTEVIVERIGGCDALVALIGTGWLEAKDAQGRRRLDLPRDFVKAEIAAALAQGKLVIPTLIEGTTMPARETLPEELAPLADRNALSISDSRFDYDVGRLVSAIDKVLPPTGSAIASTGPGDFFQAWVRKRLGWVGLVVLTGVVIWWQWDHLMKLRGIEPLVARMTEKALPKAVPGKFNIAVAHLEGDDKQETERLIRESLAEFPSVATLSFDRLIASRQGDSEKDERAGHERARTMLKASGADVAIWGVVLKQGNKSLPKLYWTPSRDVGQAPSAARYQATEDLRLPSIFWQDLTNVLGLLVASSGSEFLAQRGQYQADKIKPFIQRVRGLLGSSKAEQWNAATRAQVLVILGSALTTYGDQSGSSESLREAVAVFGEALKEQTREKVPLDWAATQNKLGNALLGLGERESDPARLNEAVAAFREALKERTRERVPLQWANTQSNLGNAFERFGERESDPARFNEAVAAYREALKEQPRERVPQDWAMTQNNLGNALSALGERESDPAPVNEAVAAYREALKEFVREKVPLNWGTTQNNLGNSLRILGELESNAAPLKEAVTACREALKERTRERLPLDWAATQNNLGNALKALGERESDPALLDEAAHAYEAALLVFRPAKADHYTEVTERNLQEVKKKISQQKNAKSEVREKPR